VSGKCDVCGKTTVFGRNVSFSKRRTNRTFKPNVHRKAIVVDGVTKRIHMCTRCLRTSAKTA